MTHGKSLYVAVGDSGTILSSPDGAAWTTRNSGSSDILESVAYGDSQFVVVSDASTILSSTDGATWTIKNSGVDNSLYAISYSGQFVTVGEAGAILTSPDGATWTIRNSGTSNDLYFVTAGDGLLLAVGDIGTIRPLRRSGMDNKKFGRCKLFLFRDLWQRSVRGRG